MVMRHLTRRIAPRHRCRDNAAPGSPSPRRSQHCDGAIEGHDGHAAHQYALIKGLKRDLGRRDEVNARADRDQDAKSEYDAKIAEKTRIAGPLLEKRPSERSGRKQREGQRHTGRLRGGGEPKAERNQQQEMPAQRRDEDESLAQAAPGHPHPSSQGHGSRVVGAPSRIRLKPSSASEESRVNGRAPTRQPGWRGGTSRS